jgi:hypothetical protein
MRRVAAFVLVFAVSTGASAQLVRLEHPDQNSMALAHDAIQDGLLWLVYSDGSQVETWGGWKVGERTVTFRGAGGTLLSARLSDVNLEATQQFNQDVRAGLYVDHRVKQLENMQVRALNPEELRALYGELRAEGVALQEKVYRLRDQAACGRYRGSAAALCGMSQAMGRPSASAAFDKLVAEKRWEKTGH